MLNTLLHRTAIAMFALFAAFAISTYAQGTALSGLNVVFLGDSNTWLGGDNCQDAKGWTRWFVERTRPASVRSYARSGATWTNTAATKADTTEYTELLGTNNVIYNQVLRLKGAADRGEQAEPDLIFILAGTNDAWFQSKRPGLFGKTAEQAFQAKGFITALKPSQATSLAQSVRLSCELLQQRFPKAEIVLLTPLQTTKTTNEAIEKTGDVIEACAHRLSLPVVRLDHEGGVCAEHESAELTYTKDGAHTSPLQAQRMGRFLANRVAALLYF